MIKFFLKYMLNKQLAIIFLLTGICIYHPFRTKAVTIDAQQPVIFNATESVKPGQTIGIQGYAFGINPTVWLSRVQGTEKVLKPLVKLRILTGSNNFVAASIPSTLTEGLYTVWVENNGLMSKPKFINRARVITYEFNEVMPGTILRLFGRNLGLKAGISHVSFIHQSKIISANVLKADGFEIQFKTPENLIAGETYQLVVNNGYGGRYGDAIFDEGIKIRKAGPDPFQLEVPWGADFNFSENVYNVKTDVRLTHKAAGDGITNDRASIQEAIDKAGVKGGVVYLPVGTYKLLYSKGSGITMKSRVILKGAGSDKTRIIYGYGNPFTTERVKAPYGWTLGWPDSRTEGMALVWPGGITTSGLTDLTLQNINESGSFVHTIKDMPEGGSKLVLKNCDFDLNTGWGVAMVNVDQLLISGCVFKSRTMNVRGINAPTRTWPWDLKNSHNVIFKNNKHFYTAGRFGANGCHHALFENNTFLRDGDHQSEGETGGLSLDYTSDVVVMANTFDVSGAAIKNRNQGETILSQGGNAHQQNIGTVSSATAMSLTDKKKEFQDFTDRVSTDWQYAVHPTNYAIAIISGPATGQWRTATGNNDTTITIDKAWDIVPEAGSKYVITQWSAQQMLVKDNVLKNNNRGIWFYSGLSDVGIINNKLINSEGIYIRADQRLTTNRYNLTWNALIQDNQIINTDGKRPAYINMLLARSKTENLAGTGILGVEIRDNTIQAYLPNVTSGFVKDEGYINNMSDSGSGSKSAISLSKTAGILGTIFEHNTAVNTNYAYLLGTGAYYTVIVNSIQKNCSNILKDVKGIQNIGATGTFTDNMLTNKE